jgi:ribulose-5-phosphate 4-epimerase/fuculose-1-phosphate aldolase
MREAEFAKSPRKNLARLRIESDFHRLPDAQAGNVSLVHVHSPKAAKLPNPAPKRTATALKIARIFARFTSNTVGSLAAQRPDGPP